MNFKMCGGLFSFCFLYETVFGNGQVAITHNVSGLCVVGLSKNLKLITTLDRDITQNPCYGQAEKTHADSILQTENKIVNLQERK